MALLRPTLPDDVPCVFISAVTGQGLSELKDILWKELNSESNKLQEITAEDTLVHRDKDLAELPEELKEELPDNDIEEEDGNQDDIEDLNDFEYIDDE